METPKIPVTEEATQLRRKTIVVFGASWCKEGSELYNESIALGEAIAAAGFKLVNGGYSGTMEGTARGAARVSGSVREGVVVPTLFPHRSSSGNEFLTEITPVSAY